MALHRRGRPTVPELDSPRRTRAGSGPHPLPRQVGKHADPATELSAKRLGLLKEAIPNAARIAVIWNANDRAMTLRFDEVERAARLLNVTVQPLAVRKPEDIDKALSAMTRERPDAFFVVSDSLTTGNRKRIVDFAAAQQLPAMYEFDIFVQDGGLMS